MGITIFAYAFLLLQTNAVALLAWWLGAPWYVWLIIMLSGYAASFTTDLERGK